MLTMRVMDNNRYATRQVAHVERLPIESVDGKRHYALRMIPVLADDETCEWEFGKPCPRIVKDATRTQQREQIGSLMLKIDASEAKAMVDKIIAEEFPVLAEVVQYMKKISPAPVPTSLWRDLVRDASTTETFREAMIRCAALALHALEQHP